MEYLVLGLLIFKPMTIYDLNSAFKEGLSLIYSASYGSLQNAVKKLKKSEWITYLETVDKGRNKKIYSINEEGVTAFYDWMSSPTPIKKMETTILSKIYFLGLIEETPKQRLLVAEMIRTVRSVEEELLEYQKQLDRLDIPDDAKTVTKFQFKTLDYGVNSHKAALEWLEKLYAELDD